MEAYYYAASYAPTAGIIIFLLIELIRKKLFSGAVRKACIMVLIVSAFTVASASAVIFALSAESPTLSENPGRGIIFLPVLQGLFFGYLAIILYIILKLFAKIYAALMRSPP
ncbi:MAG: hypothetical protein ABI471_05095 [Sphingomonas bacterium]